MTHKFSAVGQFPQEAGKIILQYITGDKTLAGVMDQGGSAFVWKVLRTFQKASDPTVNDDADDGYIVSDIWINTTTGGAFILTDATAGAADWSDLLAGGGGGISDGDKGDIVVSGSGSSFTIDDGVLDVANFQSGVVDTDGALTANSDSKLSSQKAVKTYVDTKVTGLLEFKGSTDCSANPNYPSASKGDVYVVTVAGKIGGASGKSVDVGDMYLATADNAGGNEGSVGTSWSVLEHNLSGALLSANNLSDISNNATARSNLGLEIGSDVQAYDADLDTWATKTPPSGAVVGTTDTQKTSNKRNQKRRVPVTAGATPTINTDNGDVFSITGLATNITSLTTNLSGTPDDNDMMLMEITDDGTSRTITPGASFVGTANNSIASLATTAGKKLILLWMWDADISKWKLLGKDSNS